MDSIKKNPKRFRYKLYRTRTGIRKLEQTTYTKYLKILEARRNLDEAIERQQERMGRKKGMGCPAIHRERLNSDWLEYSCPLKERKYISVRNSKAELYEKDCWNCKLSHEEALRALIFNKILSSEKEELYEG